MFTLFVGVPSDKVQQQIYHSIRHIFTNTTLQDEFHKKGIAMASEFTHLNNCFPDVEKKKSHSQHGHSLGCRPQKINIKDLPLHPLTCFVIAIYRFITCETTLGSSFVYASLAENVTTWQFNWVIEFISTRFTVNCPFSLNTGEKKKAISFSKWHRCWYDFHSTKFSRKTAPSSLLQKCTHENETLHLTEIFLIYMYIQMNLLQKRNMALTTRDIFSYIVKLAPGCCYAMMSFIIPVYSTIIKWNLNLPKVQYVKKLLMQKKPGDCVNQKKDYRQGHSDFYTNLSAI